MGPKQNNKRSNEEIMTNVAGTTSDGISSNSEEQLLKKAKYSDEGTKDNVLNDEEIVEDVDDDDETSADEFGVNEMEIKQVKQQLKERKLSIKGSDKVLKKRLLDRLVKEKDPEYKPKPKGRTCKWCGSLMKKKNGFRGEFYGCSSYPNCQYTTSMSGHADPKRDHLRGVAATRSGGGDWEAVYEAREINRQRAEIREGNRIGRIWNC
jgi:hypothetical protein